ncbi:ArsR/SmtB family transcription factor [Planctomycetota bacterium]
MDLQIAERVAEVLKAVAHPVRLQIVALLETRERCVGEIMEAVGGKQAVTSQQLTVMRTRGVLATRREGTKIYYRINNPNVIKLLHCMYDHCDSKGARVI